MGLLDKLFGSSDDEGDGDDIQSAAANELRQAGWQAPPGQSGWGGGPPSGPSGGQAQQSPSPGGPSGGAPASPSGPPGGAPPSGGGGWDRGGPSVPSRPSGSPPSGSPPGGSPPSGPSRGPQPQVRDAGWSPPQVRQSAPSGPPQGHSPPSPPQGQPPQGGFGGPPPSAPPTPGPSGPTARSGEAWGRGGGQGGPGEAVTPADERTAINDLAREQFANRLGATGDEIEGISANPSSAAAMRDRALQQYMRKKQEVEAERQRYRMQRRKQAEQATQAPAASQSAPASSNGDSDGMRSTLADISGIGPAKQDALIEQFGSLDAIRGASVSDLTAVKGIGEALAKKVKRQLG